MKYKYLLVALFFTLAGSFVSCSKDNLDSTSIFPDTLPTHSTPDAFEKWIENNYVLPYNVDWQYKLNDIETDGQHNLLPADSAKSAKLSIITKYMWFDAYNEIAGQSFVKLNTPRIITLVGNPAFNPNGTETLATAEGGYKVTYDDAFAQITSTTYVSGDWYQLNEDDCLKEGYISTYARSEAREDFAELLSFYVTDTPTKWNERLQRAGTKGASLINQKMAIIKSYMQNSWNINLDDLRDSVLRRGKNLRNIDLEHLN